MSSSSPLCAAASLSVCKLSHVYSTGFSRDPALMDIGFEVVSGEFAVIIGPSGCGKSTLLSLIAGLRSIQYGSVRLNDVELKGSSAVQLQRHRQQTGIIFQSHKLIPFLTAAENVLVGAEVFRASSHLTRRHQIEELLAAVGLVGHSTKFPRQLSGGQCQRVSVARAIANNPSIIIADEPTASLDLKSTQSLVRLLLDLVKSRNIPLLMATHDSRIIEIADRVIQLEDGRIVSNSYQARR